MAAWLHQFRLVVAEPWMEAERPETTMLESTAFIHTNPRTRTTKQLFIALAAWGYPAGDAKGRL